LLLLLLLLPVDSFECMSSKVNYSTGRQSDDTSDTFTDTFRNRWRPHVRTHADICILWYLHLKLGSDVWQQTWCPVPQDLYKRMNSSGCFWRWGASNLEVSTSITHPECTFLPLFFRHHRPFSCLWGGHGGTVLNSVSRGRVQGETSSPGRMAEYRRVCELLRLRKYS